MSKKKVNPRRRPATQADVEKARSTAQDKSIYLAMAIFLTVLVDKFNGADYINDVWKEVNNLSDSINRGLVSVSDLIHTLKEEYGIELC